MLFLPRAKTSLKSEFLIVYGQNSSIEKWFALADELKEYGNVTMPDLPGFGGMESFYKINEKPSIDNYADYLASFIKLRYRRKKIVIVGLSFGFVVVTRMLQKYPNLTKRVKLLINISGFTNKDDISLTGRQIKLRLLFTKIFSLRMTAQLYRALAYDETIFHLNNKKLAKSGGQFEKLLSSELSIRRKSDTRTRMYLSHEMLKLDICQQSIDLAVWSILGEFDELLDLDKTRTHLRAVFSKYHEIKLKKHAHSGIVGVATSDDIVPLIPYNLKNLLNRQNK